MKPFTIALLGVLCLAVIMTPTANAQEQFETQCQSGICRVVPQVQFQPGTWQPRIRSTAAPLAQVMPWNWNARVVRYKQDMVFQPSGPWRPANGGSMQPMPANRNATVPLPERPATVRFVFR